MSCRSCRFDRAAAQQAGRTPPVEQVVGIRVCAPAKNEGCVGSTHGTNRRSGLQRPTQGELKMSNTVTGTYNAADQVRNVKDDLVSSGIPSEKIYVDEAARTIKVIMPKDTQPTIVQIFERHGLSGVTR
jgi:hypothetical protein